MTRFMFLGLGFFGVLGWAVEAQAQTTLTLQQGTNGYSGCMDTYIDKFDALGGNDFFGNIERIELRDGSGGTTEKMNLFIKFDVSSLPATATVTGAKLTLYNIRANGNTASDVIILSKVTSAWNNQSTWNMGVPTTVASGVTCPSPAGYAQNVATPPPASEKYVITGMESLVQDWKTTPGNNYGIMLSCTSDINFRFASSEYSTVSVRPALEITYTTPAPAPPPTVTVNAPPTSADSSPVPVTGTAGATSPAVVTQVAWVNGLTGAAGTATGTTSWSAAIPLGRGNNAITVTVTDSVGGTASTTFTVYYNPPKAEPKDNHQPCGLGIAGGSSGSFAGAALALALLLIAVSRRPA